MTNVVSPIQRRVIQIADPSNPNPRRTSEAEPTIGAARSFEGTTEDVRDGNLDQLWRRHGDQLRRRARTRLRQYGLSGQTESMDICNDVMLDLSRRRPDITDEGELLRYILRAIDHQVIDTFRMLARQCRDFRRTHSIDEPNSGWRGGGSSAKIGPVGYVRKDARRRRQSIVGSSTPSGVAMRKEILVRVRQQLGGDHAMAVDAMLEGRDWAEIGSLMNVPPDTIRMRVRRAIDRVRTEFESRCGGLPAEMSRETDADGAHVDAAANEHHRRPREG